MAGSDTAGLRRSMRFVCNALAWRPTNHVCPRWRVEPAVLVNHCRLDQNRWGNSICHK
jgi:hypothetical protein